TIASKPPRDHVFQVNNFEALKTIQNQLREKIFAIEGTQTGSGSSFEHEMSQEGFSAAITSNGPLLSTVGSYDWAGGVFLYTSKEKSTFINMTRVDSDMNDAYLDRRLLRGLPLLRGRGQQWQHRPGPHRGPPLLRADPRGPGVRVPLAQGGQIQSVVTYDLALD
ncbi:ITGAM isoform 4, partial [Pan troglodytes]